MKEELRGCSLPAEGATPSAERARVRLQELVAAELMTEEYASQPAEF